LMGCRRHGQMLRIEIHDTGSGIPDEKLELIFEEFHRLETDGDGPPGLGLGLAIVDRIAKVLGHNIGVRSKTGKGSLFAVEVPLSAAPAVQSAPRRQTPPGLAPTLTVLVIDNEKAILDGMETLLSGWGCRVHRA